VVARKGEAGKRISSSSIPLGKAANRINLNSSVDRTVNNETIEKQ
jgi:hypothetical protein